MTVSETNAAVVPAQDGGHVVSIGSGLVAFFPRKKQCRRTFLGLVNLMLARRRQEGIKETGSGTERPQKGVVDGHG